MGASYGGHVSYGGFGGGGEERDLRIGPLCLTLLGLWGRKRAQVLVGGLVVCSFGRRGEALWLRYKVFCLLCARNLFESPEYRWKHAVRGETKDVVDGEKEERNKEKKGKCSALVRCHYTPPSILNSKPLGAVHTKPKPLPPPPTVSLIATSFQFILSHYSLRSFLLVVFSRDFAFVCSPSASSLFVRMIGKLYRAIRPRLPR